MRPSRPACGWRGAFPHTHSRFSYSNEVASALKRKAVLSVDLDEWYHCRWATGAPRSRWPDTARFFEAHYGTERPIGELIGPTRETLDIFDRLGARGTFFILGEVAHFYPELVREIDARGHEIGCHGYHHTDIDLLGPRASGASSTGPSRC